MSTSQQVHSTFPLDTVLAEGEDKDVYEGFLHDALSTSHPSLPKILLSIPHPTTDSYGPLATLSALLSAVQEPWPVLQLQLTYSKAWKALPEEAKAGNASPQAQQLLDRVLHQCKQSYASLLDVLDTQTTVEAIIDPNNGHPLQHDLLMKSIREFSLPLPRSSQTKPVVAISLPNGPLLASTVLAVSAYYTAAPMAHGHSVGSEQFKADVLQSRASIVLAVESDIPRLRLEDSWLRDAGIQVVLVEADENMRLVLRNVEGDILKQSQSVKPEPNHADDTGILLFTSGTSGTKKLVPVTIHSIICGAAMVIDSWGLDSSMRCLNQMPLHHVGGLIRNLYAPIMSGGSVICCSAFDANFFWDCVEEYSPTWYYASPSMHQCILEARADRPDSIAKSKIRLVCNAAGGLLPSLASQLQDTFSTRTTECTILPSYGMTECMPISTPPMDYRLDRPGTSGISAGPEITILDGNNVATGAGVVGRICVRGAPVFNGYQMADGSTDKSCFTVQGWFDTGDLGYLDRQDFLYITGRSKEVINRGGELTSPSEVEEAIVAAAHDPASPTFGRIGKALAFSVHHDVLQEVVGICIVTPAGRVRTDLNAIQQSVKKSLSQVKIPVLLVYMDGGLPVNNNKVLRIKLAERLGLPEISDRTPVRERHYEAICPPVNAQLSTPIACSILIPDHRCLEAALESLLPQDVDYHLNLLDTYPELYLAPKSGTIYDPAVMQESSSSLLPELRRQIVAYLVPNNVELLSQPFSRTLNGSIDYTTLRGDPTSNSPASVMQRTETESKIAFIFAEVLSIAEKDLLGDADFFDCGGDSMKAGRLLSLLRKEFQIRLSIDSLFSHSCISSLALLIDQKMAAELDNACDQFTNPGSDHNNLPNLLPGCEETHCSARSFLLLLQLVPLVIIYPMKRAFMWTLFMYCLSYTQKLITNMTIPGRLVNLVASMFIARTITRTLLPLLAILFKWLVIGRHKEGVYPMWSRYHTRWWICQKAAQVAGMGIWNTFNWSRCFYHRCMGATIGKNVTLDKGVTLGEQDLIIIEDGVVLDGCVVRPFAAERNTSMYLGRIRLGSRSSIGLGSIVAAGTDLPSGTCIGPNSSSWQFRDADEANRDLSASKVAGLHMALQILLGLPIQMLCLAIGALPWLGCLTALVNHEPKANVADDLRNIAIWFASPERVGLHYAALAANATLGPAAYFLGVLAVKKCFDLCCGRLCPGYSRSFSQMDKFRMYLMRTLMPAAKLHELSELFGSHYEATSHLMRLMGARVGKRVYWPGTGPSIQDYHLLDIGDDVVFGSRSHLVTSDGIGSDRIRIGNGAMVADRVVLLPGVELGEQTVMGSGALTRRNTSYAPSTTWVGSKGGDSVCLSSGVSRPQELKLGSFSNNSSCSTLVEPLATEMSSLSAAEKGRAESPSGCLKLPSSKNIDRPRSSVRWADQEIPMKAEVETSSPFGRAFYQGEASYRVWSQLEIFIYSTTITVATAIHWNIGSISAIQLVAHLFKTHSKLSMSFLANAWYRPLTLFIFFLAIIIGIMALQSIFTLLFLISAKWILMGRRKPGCYSWDISPYCQRWQLYLKLESLRRHCYGGDGILGLLTGTHWIVLYFRALDANIGKDCSLFAGGLPSLYFTEPDLLTLGDRVAVDDASLVGHINTRGKFDLNPLYVGDRSVLRSGSRLLSGARMEADTCLLEHTLVMAGDIVDAGRTMQGWPGDEFKGSRMPTLEAKQVWSTAK